MAIQRAYIPGTKQGPLIDAAVLSGEVVGVEMPHQGWMGVMVCAVPIDPRLIQVAGQRFGLLVERTARHSPAARAGIRAADVLLNVNGTAVTYDGSLKVALTGRRFGEAVTATILRNGRVRAVRVVPHVV